MLGSGDKTPDGLGDDDDDDDLREVLRGRAEDGEEDEENEDGDEDGVEDEDEDEDRDTEAEAAGATTHAVRATKAAGQAQAMQGVVNVGAASTSPSLPRAKAARADDDGQGASLRPFAGPFGAGLPSFRGCTALHQLYWRTASTRPWSRGSMSPCAPTSASRRHA